MPKTQLLVATESFWCEVDGKDRLFQKGVSKLPADHPVVKGREVYFEPAEPRADSVEIRG